MLGQSSLAKTTRFGRGAVILRARNEEGLTVDEMIKNTPAVFAAEKHDSRSEKYTYIPTVDVLRAMAKEGFKPFEVRQGGSKDAVKKNFTKHMIRFRHASTEVLRDSHREVILVNSHDGTSSYQMMDGVFRIVCCNGLIVGDFEATRIPHKGDVINKVIDAAYTVIESNKAIGGKIENFREIEVSRAEQEAFAEAARELRFEEGTAQEIAPSLINHPRRHADIGNNLWLTFNRVQENLINGGTTYTHTNAENVRSTRTTRPVNSIDGNVALNRALWTLTAKMAELKAK